MPSKSSPDYWLEARLEEIDPSLAADLRAAQTPSPRSYKENGISVAIEDKNLEGRLYKLDGGLIDGNASTRRADLIALTHRREQADIMVYVVIIELKGAKIDKAAEQIVESLETNVIKRIHAALDKLDVEGVRLAGKIVSSRAAPKSLRAKKKLEGCRARISSRGGILTTNSTKRFELGSFIKKHYSSRSTAR